MSNAISLFDSPIPAHARSAVPSAVALALKATLSSGTSRISIKGGTFRYIRGGTEVGRIDDRHLDVVLVNAAANIGRQFYAETYEEGADPKGPTCWSADGKTPDKSSEDLQASSCAQCPKNVAGSGQGNSRACRYQQRLAVVLANDVGGEVFQLILPATSIFGKDVGPAGVSLQGFFQALTARGIEPTAVITRMKFDTSVATPKLGFAPVGWLSVEDADTAKEQGDTDVARNAITMTAFTADSSGKAAAAVMDQLPPPPKEVVKAAEAKSAAVKSAAVKPIKAETPKAEPEPEVRKTAAAAKPAVSEKMASLAAAWLADDE